MAAIKSRREFIKLMASASLLPSIAGPSAGAVPVGPSANSSAAKVRLEPFNYSGVRLRDGMLKRQYQATRDFFFNLADDSILKGFRERAGLPAPGEQLWGWYGGDSPPKEYPAELPRLLWTRGDFANAFGQWLSGMARMYRAEGDQPMLDKATGLMKEWAKAIDPDGYFYYSRNPIATHYTYDKTVYGLLDLYEYGGVKEALPLLERITDWAIKNMERQRVNPTPELPAGDGYGEWYTLGENLYRAYELTGNAKYKTFGDVWRYPAYWSMFTGTAEPAPYQFHAYSHCNTLSSAAKTYAVTGDPEYLKTITNAYDWFERTQFYATGGYGPGERLQPPDGSRGKSLETTGASFETPCGSWAGFKLGRYLMQFTGEAKYGDWIEKLVYNGIGAALPMGPGGLTFYYSDYRIGGGRKAYFPAMFPCCSGTYIQGVADYHNLIYFKDADGLYVNLYVPSEVTWSRDGNEIKVEQETDYPETDTVNLTVHPQQSARFDLKFRVPRWSQGFTIKVNGSPVQSPAQPGSWAAIRRIWNPNDQVTIQISMPHYLVPIDQQHPKRVALMYGPVVLVRRQEALQIASDGNLSKWLAREGKPLEFRVAGESTGTFVPFYRLEREAPYVMYFELEG